jgi:dihydrofolate reductase
MKVTLITVTSLDGKTTKGDQPGTAAWASPEDQAILSSQIAAHDRIVMGSKTYQAARAIIAPNPHKLRIIATREPQRFAQDQQPGLAFTADSPEAIIAQAKADGCTSLLLMGGAETSSRFLDAGLVDELLVTIEPLLFGGGTPFTSTLRHTVQLQLVDHKQLNSRGTILARYRVQKTIQGASPYENPKN